MTPPRTPTPTLTGPALYAKYRRRAVAAFTQRPHAHLSDEQLFAAVLAAFNAGMNTLPVYPQDAGRCAELPSERRREGDGR